MLVCNMYGRSRSHCVLLLQPRGQWGDAGEVAAVSLPHIHTKASSIICYHNKLHCLKSLLFDLLPLLLDF